VYPDPRLSDPEFEVLDPELDFNFGKNYEKKLLKKYYQQVIIFKNMYLKRNF
jgi:hypothetical protein